VRSLKDGIAASRGKYLMYVGADEEFDCSELPNFVDLLRNGGPDRVYIAEYTVNSASTWERKTITYTASPSAGTWDYTNGTGLELIWGWGAVGGTNGTVGSWITSSAWTSANQVNVLDSAANFFRITGIKLELGSVATPIQFVPFEVELVRCKRYFEKSFNYAEPPRQNAGLVTGEYVMAPTVAGAVTSKLHPVPFAVQKRVVPAMTTYNPQAVNAQIRNATDGTDFTNTQTYKSDSHFTLEGTGTAGTALGENLVVHWIADAEF
jgi:hypothetical protein